MVDRVGSVVPTQREIEAVCAEIEALSAKVSRYTVALSREERAGTTKFRRGGERIVALVTDLATRFGVVLPDITVESVHADLTLAQRLRPVARSLAALSQTIDDTVLQAESECWWATTALYSTLNRMSAGNPALRTALAPAIEFFAIGKRRAPKPTPGG